MEKINEVLSSWLTDAEKSCLEKYWKSLVHNIENINNISLEEFKKICKEKFKTNFFWSDDEMEVNIIKNYVVKPLESAKKYEHIKFLWWYVNTELEKYIEEALKKLSPNGEESCKLNWILPFWDMFWYSTEVIMLLEKQWKKRNKITEEDHDDEKDLEEEELKKDELEDTKFKGIIDIDDLELE